MFQLSVIRYIAVEAWKGPKQTAPEQRPALLPFEVFLLPLPEQPKS